VHERDRKRKEREQSIIYSDICARPTCQPLPHTCRIHFLVDLTLFSSSVVPTLNVILAEWMDGLLWCGLVYLLFGRCVAYVAGTHLTSPPLSPSSCSLLHLQNCFFILRLRGCLATYLNQSFEFF
jgi:hypothetical protein